MRKAFSKMNSDIWYAQLLASVINRFKAVIVANPNPLNLRTVVPENVEYLPMLHILVEKILSGIGVTFPDWDRIEVLKYEIRKDVILWMVQERPAMITFLLQDPNNI
jgi:hypothetical protein